MDHKGWRLYLINYHPFMDFIMITYDNIIYIKIYIRCVMGYNEVIMKYHDIGILYLMDIIVT